MVSDALTGVGVGVHKPPIPTTAVAAPAVLIQTPEATEQRGVGGGCRWAFTLQVLVVGSDTTGADLLGLVDSCCQALAARGIQVSTSAELYQVPNTPAALPAVLIRGE